MVSLGKDLEHDSGAIHGLVQQIKREVIINLGKNLEQEARKALEYVSTSGLSGLSQTNKNLLEYALINNLITSKQVIEAQAQYEATQLS